ncbi:MAG: glycosyltransferase family 39 protein [Flavobacteriales bacterium]
MERTPFILPRLPLHLWVVWLAVIAAGAFLDVMEVDAAQYATMARDMLYQEDPLKLYFRGADYLDKPPLLFWLSALSYKLFGVHNWSYKLPSILAALVAVHATYRYARLHHGAAAGRWAAFLFATSVAFLLMTNDVRTDTLLTAAIIAAIWTGSEFLADGRTRWLLAASFSVACGMLAKGPMGLVAPLTVLGLQVFLDRRWQLLRDPRLLLVPLVIGLLLLPMLIGLYEQHGMHGVRFFFWEQSFGRITGENRWKDDSSALYFTHELPWLMLPWTLIVLHGWWKGLWNTLHADGPLERGGPWGALVLFIALSLSQFKLPHYIYPILPLLAVQGGRALSDGLPPTLATAQRFVWWAMALLSITLLLWAFPVGRLWTLILFGGLMMMHRFRVGKDDRTGLLLGAALWLSIAWGVNTQFYPEMLRYQSNAQVGKWLHAHQLRPERLIGVGVGGTSLEFYGGGKGPYVAEVSELTTAPARGQYVLVEAEQLSTIAQRFPPLDTVLVLEDLPVQMLSVQMVLPGGRREAADKRYLLAY